MKNENKVKKEIKDFFKEILFIELDDSPQFLDNYLYLEFWDKNNIQHKFRIPYPKDKKHFLSWTEYNRSLFIALVILKFFISPD